MLSTLSNPSAQGEGVEGAINKDVEEQIDKSMMAPPSSNVQRCF